MSLPHEHDLKEFAQFESFNNTIHTWDNVFQNLVSIQDENEKYKLFIKTCQICKIRFIMRHKQIRNSKGENSFGTNFERYVSFAFRSTS